MMRDLMSQAYSAMRYNRRRTALTMLGMAWGIATVVLLLAFGARGAGRPLPASPKDWRTKVVAVLAQGDLVCVATRSELPDPRNPGQTYTTTHFDMWRFVDGKADEHWDEGRINPPPPPKP